MGYDVEDLPLREAGQVAVEAVYDLNGDVELPRSLDELGIPADKIPEMAKIALTVTRPVENNPRKPSLEDVIRVYEIAHKGW
jgi:alcohol dehydrogenase